MPWRIVSIRDPSSAAWVHDDPEVGTQAQDVVDLPQHRPGPGRVGQLEVGLTDLDEVDRRPRDGVRQQRAQAGRPGDLTAGGDEVAAADGDPARRRRTTSALYPYSSRLTGLDDAGPPVDQLGGPRLVLVRSRATIASQRLDRRRRDVGPGVGGDVGGVGPHGSASSARPSRYAATPSSARAVASTGLPGASRSRASSASTRIGPTPRGAHVRPVERQVARPADCRRPSRSSLVPRAAMAAHRSAAAGMPALASIQDARTATCG